MVCEHGSMARVWLICELKDDKAAEEWETAATVEQSGC